MNLLAYLPVKPDLVQLDPSAEMAPVILMRLLNHERSLQTWTVTVPNSALSGYRAQALARYVALRVPTGQAPSVALKNQVQFCLGLQLQCATVGLRPDLSGTSLYGIASPDLLKLHGYNDEGQTVFGLMIVLQKGPETQRLSNFANKFEVAIGKEQLRVERLELARQLAGAVDSLKTVMSRVLANDPPSSPQKLEAGEEPIVMSLGSGQTPTWQRRNSKRWHTA